MRQLIHILMSPTCRLARLALGEKRLDYSLKTANDPAAHLPVLIDEDETAVTGIWAIVDHLEGRYPDCPLVPEETVARAETFRLLDWTLTKFDEDVTKRIVNEKASRGQTGSAIRRPPNMDTIRQGRTALIAALNATGPLADRRGFLAGREISLADLALAAHLSALDYYGEVPWTEVSAISEWYTRVKSRPSFRPLLADRVPGQPPVLHYAELDF